MHPRQPELIKPESSEQAAPVQMNSASWHGPMAGVIAGLIGGTMNYPFEGAKKREQSGQTQPWNMPGIRPHTFVREIYRGGSSFIFSLAPVSMAQATARDYVLGSLPANPSLWTLGGAYLLAGAAGAPFSAAIEHLVITQQTKNMGLFAATKYLFSRGITYPWTALGPLIFREAIFGTTWMALAPMAGKSFKEYTGIDSEIPGKVAVGVFGAAISHPFDTIGTRKQHSEKRISSLEACRQIISSEKGWKGLYAGYVWRSFLFTGCMIVIGESEKYLKRSFRDSTGPMRFFQPVKPVNETQPVAIQPATKQPADSPRLPGPPLR